MLGPATTCTIDTTLSQPFDRYGTHTKKLQNRLDRRLKIHKYLPSFSLLCVSVFVSHSLFVVIAVDVCIQICVRSIVHSFIRSFARSFIRSFVVRSFVCLLVRCILCTWGDQPASRFLQKAFLPFLTGGAGD